jgi:uncharacterized Zn-binding protein involved in type VI secretion
MRPIILINDPTSDGGQVTAGSSGTVIDGLAVARVRDQVMCRHGVCAIATGDDDTLDEGAAVARDGDLTLCGARLIATHSATKIF